MKDRAPLLKMLHGQGISAKSIAERSKLIKKVAVLLLVITISALFCVWSRVRIVQMGYEVSSLGKEAEDLSKEVNGLKIEVERLKSESRLQKIASQALGMHQPTGSEIVFVKKGRD